MKSKKIIALALTAAIAISAASMTAFAKEVKYNTQSDKKNPEQKLATVTLTKDDLKKEKKIVAYQAKEEVKFESKTYDVAGNTKATPDEWEKFGELQDKFEPVEKEVYYFTLNDLKLDGYERTITKQQFGWAKAKGDTDPTMSGGTVEDTIDDGSAAGKKLVTWATDADPAAKKEVIDGSKKLTVGATGETGYDYTLDADGNVTAYFVAVGRTDTDNDNIKKNQEEIDGAASDAKKAADRDAELKKLDEEKGALNNVNKGDGVETKQAPVDGPKSVKDVKEFYKDGHAFEVAGIKLDDGLSNLAWVYYVEKPAGLINGKNARAQLKLPSGYTTSGYKATVYHIKGWCKAEKVKDVNVGTNDVAFWANDFSPYVLVLTPRDAVAGTSTGNPSTGDFSAVPVAMLAAAALGATGFVAYKKRKAE